MHCRMTQHSPRRHGHDRPRTHVQAAVGGRREAAPTPVEFAIALVARVATALPRPSSALGADNTAWQAFDALLDEAATLVADTLRRDEIATVLDRLDARGDQDPVEQVLVARALLRLRDQPSR